MALTLAAGRGFVRPEECAGRDVLAATLTVVEASSGSEIVASSSRVDPYDPRPPAKRDVHHPFAGGGD